MMGRASWAVEMISAMIEMWSGRSRLAQSSRDVVSMDRICADIYGCCSASAGHVARWLHLACPSSQAMQCRIPLLERPLQAETASSTMSVFLIISFMAGSGMRLFLHALWRVREVGLRLLHLERAICILVLARLMRGFHSTCLILGRLCGPKRSVNLERMVWMDVSWVMKQLRRS